MHRALTFHGRERKEREKNREKGEDLLFRFVSHPNERFDSIASRMRNTERRENHWLEKTRGISNFIICFFFLSFSFFSFFLAAVHTSISGVRSTFLCIVYGKIVYICMSVFHVINFWSGVVLGNCFTSEILVVFDSVSFG